MEHFLLKSNDNHVIINTCSLLLKFHSDSCLFSHIQPKMTWACSGAARFSLRCPHPSDGALAAMPWAAGDGGVTLAKGAPESLGDLSKEHEVKCRCALPPGSNERIVWGLIFAPQTMVIPGIHQASYRLRAWPCSWAYHLTLTSPSNKLVYKP